MGDENKENRLCVFVGADACVWGWGVYVSVCGGGGKGESEGAAVQVPLGEGSHQHPINHPSPFSQLLYCTVLIHECSMWM